MRISSKDWKNYIDKLSKLNNIAGEKMSDYVARHGFDDPRIIDYAYGLVTKYGEGSASLSAMMYDAIAEMEGKILPSAEVAETPEYGEVAKAINGVRKHSQNPTSYGNVVNRLVKRTGADTMLQNAERDGAEFAWVPSGDTCAFCIALASRGWQHISKKTLKNGHAEHIHANCDCNYTVRFDGKSSVAGYNPEEYLEIYESAEGDTPEEKINSIRAKYRAENRDKINAQKRANYAEKHNNNLDFKPISAKIKIEGEGSDNYPRRIKDPVERAQIIREASNAKEPIYAEDLRQAYHLYGIKPKDDYYDVVIHGSPKSLEYEHKFIINAETLAYIISGRRDFHGDDIRLLSCNTGVKDNNGQCVAQEVANILKVKVLAPTGILNFNPNGTLTVGKKKLPEELGFIEFNPK